MNQFESDVNIFYPGGSGGFYFFHLLLLSRKYNVVFPSFTTQEKIICTPKWVDYSINQVVAKQWVERGTKWKSNEFWPSNKLTQSTTFINTDKKFKIYLTCAYPEQWLTNPGKKILLYTDIKSNIRLASYKNARWFLDVNRSYSHFRTIVKEKLSTSISDDGFFYEKMVKSAMDTADYCVKLQDIVNFPKQFNFTNAEQLQLRNTWLNNHPTSLLKKCGININ